MRKGSIFLLCVAGISFARGYTPTNLSWSYDIRFSQQEWAGKYVDFRAYTEYMTGAHAYDENEKQVKPTQIYNATESVLAMLEGYNTGSTLNLLANRLRGFQDGTRGTFSVTGGFEAYTVHLGGWFHVVPFSLPGDLSIAVEVPFQYMSFKDITWTSLTKQETLQDDMVRTELASNSSELSSFVTTNGSLNIGSQSAQGIGDVSVLFHWKNRFIQYQRRLKRVDLSFRTGLTIPTGHEQSIDKAFDVDFGHDGTWVVPFGMGLLLDLDGNVRVGIDVGMTMLIRRTKEWRLKTSWAQTEHLLLSKGKATKEYGPEWKFTLYGQSYDLMPGLVMTMGYQFYKHTDSTFYPQGDTFSSSIINTSPTIESSESHSLLTDITYNPGVGRGWRVAPELTLHAKVPFNGRRMISGYVLGVGCSLRF